MAGIIVVDRLESDASYASSINIASPVIISNTATFSSNTVLTSNVLYLANTNNFALQFQPDVAGRLRIASSASTFGDNNPFVIERPSSASAQNDAITIRSGGVVDLGKGQLKFPASQNASSDANTLDDYEEGTWTPVITNGTTGVTSYYWQSGLYRKIGNLVWIEVQISVNVVGISSGNIKFTGLPFPVAQKPGLGTQSKTIFTGTKYAGSPSGAISMIIESSSPSEILPYLTSDISTQLSYTSLTGGGQWHFQGSYISTS